VAVASPDRRGGCLMQGCSVAALLKNPFLTAFLRRLQGCKAAGQRVARMPGTSFYFEFLFYLFRFLFL